MCFIINICVIQSIENFQEFSFKHVFRDSYLKFSQIKIRIQLYAHLFSHILIMYIHH